jgi:hypothetical protein
MHNVHDMHAQELTAAGSAVSRTPACGGPTEKFARFFPCVVWGFT